MKRIKIQKIDSHLEKLLKDEKFRKGYELERAKAALAQKLAEIRQDEHLKQADLARRLNVSQQFISQIETAQETNLTLETLLKIADSLGRGIRISFPKLSSRDPRLKIA